MRTLKRKDAKVRKLIFFIFGIFFSGATIAQTVNINWMVHGSVYDTSTCTVGDDLILPSTNPTKYGYTFRGWATDIVQLEYIKSTGTQWIDTDVMVSDGIKIEVVGHQDYKDVALFGVSGKLYLFAANTSSVYYGFGDLASNIADIDANPLLSAKTIIMSKSDGLVIDGVQYVDFSSATSLTSQYPISLFGRRSNDNGTVAKLGSGGKGSTIYYCKIWNNGTLVRNLVPAQRSSDSAIGMFDLVSQTFFENAGSGTFVAGPSL